MENFPIHLNKLKRAHIHDRVLSFSCTATMRIMRPTENKALNSLSHDSQQMEANGRPLCRRQKFTTVSSSSSSFFHSLINRQLVHLLAPVGGSSAWAIAQRRSMEAQCRHRYFYSSPQLVGCTTNRRRWRANENQLTTTTACNTSGAHGLPPWPLM